MQAKAQATHVRISPRKVKIVLDLIRNKPVDVAAAILKFTPKAACEPVGKLLKSAVDTAEKLGMDYRVGNILSNDLFYDDGNRGLEWQKMGVLAVEMEAAALYMNAARAGKNALAICTISDNIVTGAECTAEERQNSFTQMMELALTIA